MLKNILWLSFALSLLLLTSCATKVPNIAVCAEINPERGGCTRIVSGEQFFVDEDHPHEVEVDGKKIKFTWWELRPYMIQLPYPEWVAMKQFIIKICKKHEKSCQQEVTSWDRTVEGIDTEIKKRLPKQP